MSYGSGAAKTSCPYWQRAAASAFGGQNVGRRRRSQIEFALVFRALHFLCGRAISCFSSRRLHVLSVMCSQDIGARQKASAAPSNFLTVSVRMRALPSCAAACRAALCAFRLPSCRRWRYLFSLLPWRANRARSAPPPPRSLKACDVGGGA